ncbi:MAG: alpha/beta hydrolase-fold protein [Acidobacteriota bacterium]
MRASVPPAQIAPSILARSAFSPRPVEPWGGPGRLLEWQASWPDQPPRQVWIWCPPGFRPGDGLPTLLFHDGQNVFQDSTSFAGSWRAATPLGALAEHRRPAVAVAVANGGRRRIDEYTPFVDPRHGGGGAEVYLDALERSVLSVLANERWVVPGRIRLVGSSLGGLVSLWSHFRRPDLFDGCAALSPSIWFARRAILGWLRRQRLTPGQRIYLDVGTAERGRPRRGMPIHFGSRRYVRSIDRVHTQLEALGFRDEVDLRVVVDPDGTHSERAWARRLPAALDWMLAEGREMPALLSPATALGLSRADERGSDHERLRARSTASRQPA